LIYFPLDEIKANYKSHDRHFNRYTKVIRYLLHDIKESSNKYYAQTASAGFWYKAVVFTKVGTILFDTGSSRWILKANAKWLVDKERLTEVSINDLIENWNQHSMHDSRTVEKLMAIHWGWKK